ncbi:MAG TPA: SDR family NAD(P)-dependent oxidoreductase [archaeon]|nr:SDR family NAD(P)-dependent oxidoreductase [archaeon]
MGKIGLVTGCAGFIGSHLCERLLAEGWKVLGLDNLSTGNMENISQFIKNPNFVFFEGDVTKPEDLEKISTKNIDCIFHHAGKKMVFSVKQPREDLLTNIYGTLNMLKWASEHNAGRFIFASTIAVYGSPKEAESTEESEIAPTNPYGVSKYSCEEYCRLWHRQYNIPAIIFRYASVYGPRQAVDVGVVNTFIQKIRADGPITVYGDGNSTRPFTFVADVVEANLLAANTKDTSVFGETFNVAMAQSVSISQLIGTISGKMKKTPKINHEKERSGEMKHMGASIEKIKKMMGFKPGISIQEGISRTVDYYEKK